MTKAYMSLQLINNQTILCEVESGMTDDGYYIIHNPVKPVAVDGKLGMIAMNPFSDSSVYLIHPSHVISAGSMHFAQIDSYNENVERIDKAITDKYNELTSKVDSDEVVHTIKENVTIH